MEILKFKLQCIAVCYSITLISLEFPCFVFFVFILFFHLIFFPQSFVLLFYYHPPTIAMLIVGNIIRPFPNPPEPLYQKEVKCSAFDVEMTFHSRTKKPSFL